MGYWQTAALMSMPNEEGALCIIKILQSWEVWRFTAHAGAHDAVTNHEGCVLQVRDLPDHSQRWCNGSQISGHWDFLGLCGLSLRGKYRTVAV